MAAIFGLVAVFFMAIGDSPPWVLIAVVSVFLVWFLFQGFQAWRLQPGTATVAYGWSWLVSIGVKKVLVEVTSVQYELEAWDAPKGAWHTVKLVSSGRKPDHVVSRTTHEPNRNQLPVSTPVELQLVPELLAVAQLFAGALDVPIRAVSYVVPAPDPWWAAG
jgi:hypothetical protein